MVDAEAAPSPVGTRRDGLVLGEQFRLFFGAHEPDRFAGFRRSRQLRQSVEDTAEIPASPTRSALIPDT
ncbi:hypothetical protein ACLILY_30720 [Mycobacterium sp. MS3]|uniref:hypothetical protein n=1 Tax=Mycobacterium sp. MS3 TaxID=3391378 RepID=UPI0039898E48